MNVTAIAARAANMIANSVSKSELPLLRETLAVLLPLWLSLTCPPSKAASLPELVLTRRFDSEEDLRARVLLGEHRLIFRDGICWSFRIFRTIFARLYIKVYAFSAPSSPAT